MFLYHCVIYCDRGELAQMLTKSHNTNSIQFWLIKWLRSGASRLREVICNFSNVLLTAITCSFSGYLIVKNYANAYKNIQSNCYVRIDVAHFVKKYASFLKTFESYQTILFIFIESINLIS